MVRRWSCALVSPFRLAAAFADVSFAGVVFGGVGGVCFGVCVAGFGWCVVRWVWVGGGDFGGRYVGGGGGGTGSGSRVGEEVGDFLEVDDGWWGCRRRWGGGCGGGEGG